MNHEYYMARALQLAKLGLYSTSPNPRVGCVIVREGVIVGEGWHKKAGGPHAEVDALQDAGDMAKSATAYVTLEPCSHTGRTAPCVEALITAGVAEVIGATRDPNPLVSGRGYALLRDADIEVTEHCLQAEAEALNAGFMKRMRTGLPLVRVKLAQSLDGRSAMASGESRWITGPAARRDVQRLRARSCAVITGADSILIDNPAMTVRPDETGIDLEEHLWRQPLRVVIDGRNRVSSDAKIFAQKGDVFIVTRKISADPITRDEKLGKLEYWQSESKGKVDLYALLQELGKRGCNEVLVESGATLAGAFVAAGLVDELILYCAPTLLGSNARPLLSLPLNTMDEQLRWHWQDMRQVGEDLRLTLRPVKPVTTKGL